MRSHGIPSGHRLRGQSSTTDRRTGDGSLVGVIPAAMGEYCAAAGLDFDERALLEHLVDVAARVTGEVRSSSLTDLAAELGHGPSGRRTLATRLRRLAECGAIEWTPPGRGGLGGRLVLIVHRRLVHQGRCDRQSFVLVRRRALTDYASAHGLSPTTRAALHRLLLEANPWRRALLESPAGVMERWGLGRRRGPRVLAELAAAGAVRCLTDRLEVAVFADLVHSAPRLLEGGSGSPLAVSGPPHRASSSTTTRVDDDQNARATCAFAPLDGYPDEPDPEDRERRAAVQGQGQVLLEALAKQAPAHARYELLVDPTQGGGRRYLRRALVDLAEVVGDELAVALVADAWPVDARPMAHGLARARRRLEQARLDTDAGARLRADLDAERVRGRRSQLAGAANYGRSRALAGLDGADVLAGYPDDPEAAAVALESFARAQAALAGAVAS